MERQRKYLRERRQRLKGTKSFKDQKAKDDLKYKIKVRDSSEYREKRNNFNLKYFRDPVSGPKIREAMRNWRNKNPEKVFAHNTLNNAIKGGKVVRPSACFRCGKSPLPCRDGRSGLNAHHPDYSKPLEVQWLCIFCHGLERRKV